MEKWKKKDLGLKLSLILSLIMMVLIVLVIGVWLSGGNKKKEVSQAAEEKPQTVTVEKLVTVKEVITGNVIREKLNNVGFMISQEYYFTEVVSASEVVEWLGIFKGLTESSYVVSYDGLLSAGIDFTKITVDKNEDEHTVMITIPKAEIKSIDVDPESLVVISQKDGFGTNISIEEFNKGLIELEKTAKEKALAKGILDKANDNALKMIKNMVEGLVDPSEYVITYSFVS